MPHFYKNSSNKKNIPSNFRDTLIQNKAIELQDNRPTFILQKKDYKTTTNFDSAQPVQLFSADDIKFMYDNKYGLRHHDTKIAAENEQKTGTEGGDAVPLNPLGKGGVPLAFCLMRGEKTPDKVVQQFIADVDQFISNSLSRTVKIELNVSTPRMLIAAAVNKSTFLLVKGMEGIDSPKDVEKKDYAGLGKAGKQKINKNQIIHLMALNDDSVDMEFIQFVHGEKLDTPIQTHEEGEEVFSTLVMIFSEKLKDAVYKLRTGKDRFLVEE